MTDFDMGTPPPAVPPPPSVIRPDKDSRLEQLCAQYDDAKIKAEESKERLEAIKNEIKSELALRAPGQHKIDLECQYLRKPLRMVATFVNRFDSKQFKTDHPEMYPQYVKQSAHWRLEERK